MSALYVPLVPEAGAAYKRAIRVTPQPVRRRGIKRCALVIAQQRNRISLDPSAQACRTRLVIHGKPEKRHRGDSRSLGSELPHFNEAPQKLYQQFRDEVIITGKCEGYELAHRRAKSWVPGDPPITWSAKEMAEANAALDDCWLDFIAPRT